MRHGDGKSHLSRLNTFKSGGIVGGMPVTSSPSQRTLADLLGVSLGTVSMALRGDPRVALETRARVLKAAAERGYSPDPLLAGRMNDVRRRRAGARPAVKLAHVVAWDRLELYYGFAPFREFREGAAARAAEFGYELEDFLLDEARMSARRLSGILRARAIPGVLIAPVQQPEKIVARVAAGEGWLRLDFAASATIGYTLELPRISRTVHDHAGAVELACARLAERGYRRVGLVMSEVMHRRVRGRWLAGWVCAQEDMASAPRPLVSARVGERVVFDAWLKAERPDAILTCEWGAVEAHLARRGLVAARDLGVVDLQKLAAESPHAAVDQCNREVGAAAVDILLAQMGRHERGEPAVPKTVLVPGRWVEGPSVRAASLIVCPSKPTSLSRGLRSAGSGSRRRV